MAHKKNSSYATRQENDMENFLGEFIRQWRIRHKKSLKVLAAEVGISITSLSDIELGHSKPRMETLEVLAKVLGVGPDFLFALRVQPAPSPDDADATLEQAIRRHPYLDPVSKDAIIAILRADAERRDANEKEARTVAEPRSIYRVPPEVIAAAGDVADLELPHNKKILDDIAKEDEEG